MVNELSSEKRNLLYILNFLNFNDVCNINNNEKSTLKCKYTTHRKKLGNLIPGYKVNPTRLSHDSNKVIFNFSSHVITNEKRLLCKGLRFSIPPKKIEYSNFLTQFELLYRDTLMFEMKSENCNVLKDKIKNICVSTLKSYLFDKVEKKYQKQSL